MVKSVVANRESQGIPASTKPDESRGWDRMGSMVIWIWIFPGEIVTMSYMSSETCRSSSGVYGHGFPSFSSPADPNYMYSYPGKRSISISVQFVSSPDSSSTGLSPYNLRP